MGSWIIVAKSVLAPLHPQQCLVCSHQDLPLHHVQQWMGTHFNRTCLSEMGLVHCLGHGTVHCPNSPVGSKGWQTMIIHTNGIHKLNIEFCCCAHASADPFQLMSASLFPATTNQPETAFSFTVLKEFHAHTLSSKKSGYDYFIALQKLTNNAFLDETFVHVCRD